MHQSLNKSAKHYILSRNGCTETTQDPNETTSHHAQTKMPGPSEVRLRHSFAGPFATPSINSPVALLPSEKRTSEVYARKLWRLSRRFSSVCAMPFQSKWFHNDDVSLATAPYCSEAPRKNEPHLSQFLAPGRRGRCVCAPTRRKKSYRRTHVVTGQLDALGLA